MKPAFVPLKLLDGVRPLRGRPTLQLAPPGGAFAGRDRELAALLAAVESGARRIWIGAASGLGKTELLAQLVGRCRERGAPYHWLAPHEPATPRVLGAIVHELGRIAGAHGARRLLVIDDFARLRPVESWFVERFLPGLPDSVCVIVADRAADPAWRDADAASFALALAPLGEADARRYLTLRGISDAVQAEIVAGAEGIPALLAAAADAECPLESPRVVALADEAARFYIRHDSDEHRLAIAVMVAARTAPYELLELAFDDPRAARDAHAWLSRLSVVAHTPAGLRPDTLLRRVWERELAERVPALWARARAAVRAFADHRIATAHEPMRWLLDRLFVDRDAAAVRELVALPAGDLALELTALRPSDRGAVAELAVAQHGPRGGSVIERWLADDRADFDVLRGAAGDVRGYLCTVAIAATAELTELRAAGDNDGDDLVDACLAHLDAIDWFGLATPPDACALVFRDWSVAGTHQAPSAGAALVLAQMAARLLTTPAVELQFIVTDRPALWQRVLAALGLAPKLVGAGHGGTAALAIDWRGASVAHVLQAASEAAPSAVAAPVLAVPLGTGQMPITREAVIRARSELEARERAVAATGSVPVPVATLGAGELSAALDRRVAELARSAQLSPREHEVLQLLLLGRNYAEIGVALQITPRTARFHQHNVLEKIGAESRLDIIRLLL